jgi:integrase
LELRDALGPVVLGVAPFRLLLKELDDPFRTMVILDLATGLRCSELFALQWRDVLWGERTLLVRRAIVTGVCERCENQILQCRDAA